MIVTHHAIQAGQQSHRHFRANIVQPGAAFEIDRLAVKHARGDDRRIIGPGRPGKAADPDGKGQKVKIIAGADAQIGAEFIALGDKAGRAQFAHQGEAPAQISQIAVQRYANDAAVGMEMAVQENLCRVVARRDAAIG